MIPVLYPPNTTDFSSFGLGVLTDTISCEVTEERNGVFECLLRYPVSGQHYGLITKECIIKAKPNDTAGDQAFRIYRITKPLNDGIHQCQRNTVLALTEYKLHGEGQSKAAVQPCLRHFRQFHGQNAGRYCGE